MAGKDASVWIFCEEGKSIEIVTTLGATIKVPAQTPTTGGLIYKNLTNHGGGPAIEAQATVTGITWSCTPTFTCTLGGVTHEGQEATYTGTIIATGYEDKCGTMTLPTEGLRLPIRVE